MNTLIEAIVRRCSVKRDFIKRETLAQVFSIKKEALARVFSCKFCEISKNTFNYRTPLVAASENKILLSY